MANLKTPGVYIKEISLLPASVAPVATAIPGFVGYTRKRTLDGADLPINTPVRITSLLDFVEHFGEPFKEAFTVDISDAPTAGDDEVITVDFSNDPSPYILYYQVAMFFSNGGGPCHIISVGNYASDTGGGIVVATNPNASLIVEAELMAGLNACEEVDEITLLVVPEAILFSVASGSRQVIYDAMLTQCNKLQDRFAIMDTLTDSSNSVFDDAANFRNDDVGANDLKYGASYYPYLKTTLQYQTQDDRVYIVDSRSNPVFNAGTPTMETLIDSTNGLGAAATGTITIFDNDIDGDSFTINGTAIVEGTDFTKDAGGDAATTAGNLATEINNLAEVSAAAAGNVITITSANTGAGGNSITIEHEVGAADGVTLSGGLLTLGVDAIPATGTITLVNNNIDLGSFDVNGVTFLEGTDFNKDASDPIATTTNLMVAINNSVGIDVTVTQSGTILTITADTAGVAGNAFTLTSSTASATPSGATLSGGADAVTAIGTITFDPNNKIVTDTITVNGQDFVEGTDFNRGLTNVDSATSLEAALNLAADSAYTVSRALHVVVITAAPAGASGNSIGLAYLNNRQSNSIGVSGASLSGGQDGVDSVLHSLIKAELQKFTADLYPCGAVSGVYASVDRNRGVWKSPANVSLQRVKEPGRLVTAKEQESLNVDATSGKSINAIRNFTGKGNLIWGGRTMAGNDNEWRYVNVRRTFIFVEESVKKASEPMVFEPNDAKTWQRIKGMIENFLTSIWREGALAGAKPEDAFFVRVGLGETMTAVDILEGKLNIEIGMAVVRPAEFIVLKFSHKMQES